MKKYKIGYTCGVFDLFHVGHLNLLERCKEMCEYLIVGICNDDYVRDVKKVVPAFTEDQRVRIVQALKCVDRAVLINAETTTNKMKAKELFDFDVLFSGDDWKGSDRYKKTEDEFRKIGVAIEYFPYTVGISTSKLKENMKK